MRNPDFAMLPRPAADKASGSPPQALRDTVAKALAGEGPVVVDVAVDPAEIPSMPHLELGKVRKFGLGKAREMLSR